MVEIRTEPSVDIFADIPLTGASVLRKSRGAVFRQSAAAMLMGGILGVRTGGVVKWFEFSDSLSVESELP